MGVFNIPDISNNFYCPLPQISRWIKTADVEKLEHAAYMGKGAHMRGRTAWNEDTRRFLQGRRRHSLWLKTLGVRY